MQLLISLIFLAIYSFSATVYPSGIADADELTISSYLLSTSHPPGFPLFTLIGHFGIKLIGIFTTPAHAANLLSSIYQAGTILFIYLINQKLIDILLPQTKKRTAQILVLTATGITGFSYLIWTYATIYEITSFTALLATASLYTALNWYIKPSNFKFYLAFGLTGLLLSHYHLAIVYLPAFLFLLLNKQSFKLSKFILGLSTLFLSFILASLLLFVTNKPSTFSWDFPPTLTGLINHLVRKDYEGVDIETNQIYASAFGIPNLLDSISLQSVIQYFSLLTSHFNLIILIVMIFGYIFLYRHHRSLFWFMIILHLFSGPLVAAYMKTASYSFQASRMLGIAERQLILGEIAAAMAILPGLMAIIKFKPKLYLFLPILVLIEFLGNKTIITQTQSRSFHYQYLTQNLQSLEPNSLIICTTDNDCYGLWYATLVHHLRPDIDVFSQIPVYRNYYLSQKQSIYPFSLRVAPYYLEFLIAHNYPLRPIYLTGGLNFYDAYLGLENGPFFLQPKNNMFKLSTIYPNSISYSPVTLPQLDSKALYANGITEVIANNQAYAGYLALKYNQPEIASQFLESAQKIDQSSAQIQELIQNQTLIGESIKIVDPQMTPEKLLAEKQYRFAYLLAPTNQKIIQTSLDHFTASGDTVTAQFLQELLLYNDQANPSSSSRAPTRDP